MSNKKKLFTKLTALFLMLVATATAQYRLPIYTDYLTDNYYILHPAMAGAHYEGMKSLELNHTLGHVDELQ